MGRALPRQMSTRAYWGCLGKTGVVGRVWPSHCPNSFTSCQVVFSIGRPIRPGSSGAGAFRLFTALPAGFSLRLYMRAIAESGRE